MDYAIIAAGEGSRLAQEGVKWPKPLVRLNGVALIDRLIDVFLKNNATSISIIVNEEMTEVQDYLKALRLPIPFYTHEIQAQNGKTKNCIFKSICTLSIL